MGMKRRAPFCVMLLLYRRAYGNRRLWSGGDLQATNKSVRPVTRLLPKQAVTRPRNPLPLGTGRVKHHNHTDTYARRALVAALRAYVSVVKFGHLARRS